MVSSRSVFCSCKKSRFREKKREASKVLSSLGIKIPILSKLFIDRDILF